MKIVGIRKIWYKEGTFYVICLNIHEGNGLKGLSLFIFREVLRVREGSGKFFLMYRHYIIWGSYISYFEVSLDREKRQNIWEMKNRHFRFHAKIWNSMYTWEDYDVIWPQTIQKNPKKFSNSFFSKETDMKSCSKIYLTPFSPRVYNSFPLIFQNHTQTI